MKTKGVKNVLNKELNNVQKFWELNKLSKLQTNEHKVRTHEQMIDLAKSIINSNQVDENDKWYDYYKKWASAQIETNKFGKKLWVKF